ncbi:hypothetical protein Taro_033360 [Colocasia esculenta]|uniref:Uncharacterized protein n=1 Tax=Colocasia esculenta TaxID=4460 RepID=A0A843VZY6_COLES|nr:hypothetical protein [Colocasia esculenta]
MTAWGVATVSDSGCYRLPGTSILVRLRGSVRGDERTQVTNSGVEGKTVVRTVASSRLQSSLGWSGTPRMARVLPGAGETSQQRPGASWAEETGR